MFETMVTVTAACVLFLLGGLRLRKKCRCVWCMPAFIVTGVLLLFELALLRYPQHMDSVLWWTLLFQALLCPAWLLFSLAYSREFSMNSLRGVNGLFLMGSLVPLVAVIWGTPRDFFYSPDFRLEHVLFLEPLSFFFYLQLLLFFFVALGNIEASLRAAEHGARWRIKYALVGAGTILTIHILFYSQALIGRLVDMDYLLLKAFGLLVGCLLFHYSEITRDSARVTLSERRMVRSAISIIAGVYLLGVGVILEGNRYFGASFSRYAVIAIVFCVSLGGIILLLSDRVRRRIRLELHKWFFREKYDYRTQWMELTRSMSVARSTAELLRVVLMNFCETFGFSGAAFFPVDRHDHTVLRPGTFHELAAMEAMPSADCHVLFQQGPEPHTPKELAKKVSEETARGLTEAGISLVLPVFAGADPEGVLLLGRCIDSTEEHGLEDYQLLAVEALQVGLTVRSFRLGDELAVAREMEAMGRVAALILHDLKNQVYPLSLMLGNAQEFMDDKAFQRDLLRTLGNTVNNMKKLIHQLTHLPEREMLRREPVELAALARGVGAMLPQASVRLQGGPVTVMGDKEQLEKVVLNLLTNALETGGEAAIEVEVGLRGGVPFLSVSDYGGGIDEAILQEGLFRPFRTSKKRGMGIGLYHCRKIMDAHRGSIMVENRVGEGASFTVLFESS